MASALGRCKSLPTPEVRRRRVVDTELRGRLGRAVHKYVALKPKKTRDCLIVMLIL